MQTELLNVTGMTCGGCTGKVTHALEAVGGVDEVVVSLTGGSASVKFDEHRTSPADLKAAVEQAGYGVTGPDTGQTEKKSTKGGCCS